MMLSVRYVFFVLITVVLATSNDREGELNRFDDYELVHDGERTSWILKKERRHLLSSSDRNKVELYVMSNPALTQRYKDEYGSNRAFDALKTFVLKVVNGASRVYEKKDWGSAGKISLHLVELEAVSSYSGAYTSLYPSFPYTDTKMAGKYNCEDPLKYGKFADGGCMITGNTDTAHQDKSMLWKFKKWTSQYKSSQKYDAHLLMVGNPMAGIAGVAFRSGMCKKDWNVALISARLNVLMSDIKTAAHELGHTFGMQHDTSRRTGSVMGGWSSWDGEPSFGDKAKGYLNQRFKENSKLSCLRNGVRSFKKGSTSGSGSGSSSGGSSSGGSSSGQCLQVKNVDSYFDGEYYADGTVNGRTAYKQDSYRYLYTALSSNGAKYWTLYRKKDGRYLNKNYYCLKTFISACSGNWLFFGSRQYNSRFGSCGSLTGDDSRCLEHNTYGDALVVSGSLWDDSKTFEVKTDECMNNKPIFHHIVDENATYRLYYDQYEETVDTEEISGRWIITWREFMEAECDEEHLLDCVRGKWQIYQNGNDSVAIVTDETLFVSQSTSAKEANEANSITQSAFFWIALALFVIVLVVFAVFMCRQTKGEKAKIAIDEESEDEEIEVQLDGVDVEETNLTQTTA